jgi:MoaA/NifB/PqqE/SkfB family radical SAM enzyme
MPVRKMFCSIPWTEVHINADGTYHTCGAQPNTMSNTNNGKIYNVHNMSISDWINSEYQKTARLKKLNGIPEIPLCNICYHEETVGSSSKRVRENLKSNISDANFDDDYKNSLDFPIFEYSAVNNGVTNFLHPTSYHLSLGNECNLACKMCSPTASSKLAAQMINQGTYQGPVRMNWTDNDHSWNSVVDFICQTKNLKFVHIIGGEPLLNPKFNDLIDRLLKANQTNIYLGFTTNGTIFDNQLIDKLDAFRHVDIGISIEGTGILNDFIREQTNSVLHNIESYLNYRKQGHVYVTLRTVPSALSVHTLDHLYQWCIDRQLDVMSGVLTNPAYMQIRNLPQDIKTRLIDQYSKWEYSEPLPGVGNPRDPTRFREHIDNEIRSIIASLQQSSDSALTKTLYTNLEAWGWFNNAEIRNYFYL